MQEKILVKSERYDIGKLLKRIALVCLVVLAIICFCRLVPRLVDGRYEELQKTHEEHVEKGYCWIYDSCSKCDYIYEYPTKADYILYYILPDTMIWVELSAMVLVILICGFIYLWLRSYELIVTDKRVYGKVAWGKRVDLPIDAVSATGYLQGWKGVTISTASGRLSFRVIKNAEKIYSVVNELLIERQSAKASGVSGATPQPSDSADQLKKYKDLLDAGVINQEEFDAKKKQILDI